MAKDNVLHFRLDGVDYTLRGDKSPEQMEEVVKMVGDKIEQIRSLSPHYSSVRASTLAALQLAADLQDAREEARQLLDEAALSRPATRRRTTQSSRSQTSGKKSAANTAPAEPAADTLFADK